MQRNLFLNVFKLFCSQSNSHYDSSVIVLTLNHNEIKKLHNVQNCLQPERLF